MTNILLYDLEITPILGWTYDMWDARVIKVEQEPYIMSVSWKWLDSKGIQNYNIELDSDDYFLVERLWQLMDKADIVVAHNAKKFDNRVSAARFMMHGFLPPSPYKTVDTLLAARRFFKFPSNGLNDMCHRLGLGEKPKTTHASLWHDCINGDEKAWGKMVKYNNNDVVLLEKLYLRLLPYITNHPNVSVNKEDGCPRCGSANLEYRGYYTTNVSSYHRLMCKHCGAWSRERMGEKQHPAKVAAV
jgi:DNA polymerase elongation subunit (family B)